MANFVKEHDTTISNTVKDVDASSTSCQKSSMAVDESTRDCKQETANIEKLISDAHVFLDSLKAATEKNTPMVITSVDTLTNLLQIEKKHFKEARRAIKSDYNEFQSSVNQRLNKL